mmetsp:Transcript_33210/g.75272  ORF Transcript_33210/g.75272 Transcript_33210/m.75272 type:complete len:216 (+) Transcript_33210:1388-2035(+)
MGPEVLPPRRHACGLVLQGGQEDVVGQRQPLRQDGEPPHACDVRGPAPRRSRLEPGQGEAGHERRPGAGGQVEGHRVRDDLRSGHRLREPVRDRGGEAGQGQQGPHVGRDGEAPDESLHGAHGEGRAGALLPDRGHLDLPAGARRHAAVLRRELHVRGHAGPQRLGAVLPPRGWRLEQEDLPGVREVVQRHAVRRANAQDSRALQQALAHHRQSF